MTIPTINPQLIIEQVTATVAAKTPNREWQLILSDGPLGRYELAEHPQTKIRVRVHPYSVQTMTTRILMSFLADRVYRLIKSGALSLEEAGKYTFREVNQSPLN